MKKDKDMKDSSKILASKDKELFVSRTEKESLEISTGISLMDNVNTSGTIITITQETSQMDSAMVEDS